MRSAQKCTRFRKPKTQDLAVSVIDPNERKNSFWQEHAIREGAKDPIDMTHLAFVARRLGWTAPAGQTPKCMYGAMLVFFWGISCRVVCVVLGSIVQISTTRQS